MKNGLAAFFIAEIGGDIMAKKKKEIHVRVRFEGEREASDVFMALIVKRDATFLDSIKVTHKSK